MEMSEEQVKTMFKAFDKTDAKKRGEPYIENKNTSEYIGDAKFDFQTEFIDGEGYDTKVSISGNTICFISLSEKKEFITELKTVIEKYRI